MLHNAVLDKGSVPFFQFNQVSRIVINMYQRYKTDGSNHVHQLIISVSRHLFVTADGKFKHQKKAFDARLDKPESFTKRHVVHYLIRDHFSGLFYAELTDTSNIFSVFNFLYRAWSKKEWHPLYGVPFGLSVPKNVRSVWPQLIDFLEKIGVDSIDVTSGFQGGVRDLRTWEEELRCGLYESGYPPDYEEVLRLAPSSCMLFNVSDYRGPSKATRWHENLVDEVYVPASKEAFNVE
jgi:hypothetical protein